MVSTRSLRRCIEIRCYLLGSPLGLIAGDLLDGFGDRADACCLILTRLFRGVSSLWAAFSVCDFGERRFLSLLRVDSDRDELVTINLSFRSMVL